MNNANSASTSQQTALLLPFLGARHSCFSMLRRFLNRLTPPDRGPNLAPVFGAVLVRLAKADGVYTADERAMIMSQITPLLGEGDTADTALNNAEEIEAAAGDTIHLANQIKQLVPLDERVNLIESAWAVVLADGSRDAHEDAIMRLFAKLMGLSDGDSARARQRVTNIKGSAS